MNHSAINKKLGHRLRAARQCRGMELDGLAARSGVKLRVLDRCEAGGGISVDDLELAAAALRLPVSHFLESCALCGE